MSDAYRLSTGEIVYSWGEELPNGAMVDGWKVAQPGTPKFEELKDHPTTVNATPKEEADLRKFLRGA